MLSLDTTACSVFFVYFPIRAFLYCIYWSTGKDLDTLQVLVKTRGNPPLVNLLDKNDPSRVPDLIKVQQLAAGRNN